MEINLNYFDFQNDVFFNWPEFLKYKIVTKGRRTGITKGAANAFIEYLIDGNGPLLWGETINGNIDRYFQRYFLPELKENKIPFHWGALNKQLTINNNFCDFRSADNPENWEGFGYKLIFLNEAGIILKNKELYVNTVLPMLLDFPDSRLIAAGVPKGKQLKNGTDHPFYILAKRAQEGMNSYQRVSLTSYNNPLIDKSSIMELEDEIRQIGGQNAVDQEIYGVFTETDAINPFLYALSPDDHFDEHLLMDYNRPVIFGIDFNLNPFAVVVAQVWRDNSGLHFHTINELSIENGSLQSMAQRIKALYSPHLYSCTITGDSLGNNRNIQFADNASNFETLRRLLGLRHSQMVIPKNPLHETSRNDCNYLLHTALKINRTEMISVKINPHTCPGTASDMRVVQCDAEGSIIKGKRSDLSQRADFIDGWRYIVNTFLKADIERHQKSHVGKLKMMAVR